MNFRNRLVIGFFTIFLVSKLDASEALKIEDMRALIQQESYAELLKNADRVAPAQRNAEWQGLIVKAARALVLGMTKVAEKDSSALRDLLWPLETAEQNFSFLLKNSEYLQAKGKSLVDASAICLKRDDLVCGPFIERLGKTSNSFPKGGAKVIATLVGKASGESLRFWTMAAVDEKSNCAEADLFDQLITKFRNSSSGPDVIDARKLLAMCYVNFETQMKKLVSEAKTRSNFLKNICPGLVEIPNQTLFIKKKMC